MSASKPLRPIADLIEDYRREKQQFEAYNGAQTAMKAEKPNPELVRSSACSENARWWAWQCKCGWMTTDTQYMSIVFDAPCPRCASKYSTFHRREMGGHSPNDQSSTTGAS